MVSIVMACGDGEGEGTRKDVVVLTGDGVRCLK